MIKTLQEFFYTRIVNEGSPEASTEASLKLATAVLLISVSRADFDAADAERDAILGALERSFGLTRAETEEIVALAEEEVDHAISLYEFSRLCDRGFTPEQKKHIVGLLWEVAYSDDRLEEREEYLIRKLAKLLHVSHRDFIDAKLRVKSEREG